jgi:uncharacterized RDD family membrane protein YckC
MNNMNIENNVQETQPDLFAEDIVEYKEASTGQRFLNYLIDSLVMQYGLGLVTGYLLGKIIVTISPDTAYDLFITRANSMELLLFNYLLSIFNYVIYYTFCEKTFKGYTLGKLITGTRAIRETGEELRFQDALLRSVSRLVPFEALSVWIGDRLWHDKWTKTTVVKSR